MKVALDGSAERTRSSVGSSAGPNPPLHGILQTDQTLRRVVLLLLHLLEGLRHIFHPRLGISLQRRHRGLASVHHLDGGIDVILHVLALTLHLHKACHNLRSPQEPAPASFVLSAAYIVGFGMFICRIQGQGHTFFQARMGLATCLQLGEPILEPLVLNVLHIHLLLQLLETCPF